LIGAAASIGVTLSILKGNELGAFLAKLLKEHGEDLRGKNSTLRKWILSAAPFRAQLLGVYRSAIELGDQDELAWTIGRLRALPISLDKRTLPDAQRESLLEWAGGLADALGRKAVVSIVDPIAGDTVNVAKFAQELRDRSIR
jgi:hypothetical protein